MAEMTVDQAQRCLDAMAKSEANTTAFIDIFGEIAALIERQEKQIAMYQMTIRLQDEHIAMKDKLLDVYRTRGGQKP